MSGKKETWMVNDGQFGTGGDDAESQVRPDESEATSPEQPSEADTESAMLDAMTRAMQSASLPGASDGADGQGDLDPDAGDESDETDEPDAEPPAGSEERTSHTDDEWASIILRDGPQRFAEVPRALQAEVARKYGDLRAQQAAQEAQTAVTDHYQRLQTAAAAIARVDEHFAEDPDGKLAWLESDDPNAATYLQLRNWIRQANSQPPQEQVAQVAALQMRAVAQYERLKDYPEQQAELQARAAQQRYRQDEEGVALMQSDVDELLAKGIEAKLAAKAAPAKKRAAERVAGAQHRRGVPTPDVTPGRSTRDSVDISQINDPNELFGLGLSRKFSQIGR